MKSILLLLILAVPAHALVMVSETRSVFADYWGGGLDRSELHVSNGTFGPFNSSATGIPFGGGQVIAWQNSTITTTGFDLYHGAIDFYGPGGVAQSDFSFTFRLDHPTPISITGYSAYFSGIASLTNVPLVWTGPNGVPDWYNNYLFFNGVLGVGQYTFTSREYVRGDGMTTHLVLNEVSVPDYGKPWQYFAASLVILLAMTVRRIP
jgi:hypothetical protein